ncbi:MAG: hypothetical protein A2806_00290 [Candidatus Terrybacteria bacterium RIFCSPHIGHO2_01_FULL_48_17]|uniref:FAD-binding FR-type domain-containing protein n=1 Tax=Candidatus Terrybacteria bacterium RIFCSPHIGHO2_01_FULL_48_17 TaxID=1802362 RepID=A0A1G2PJR9_9BACT|nr:MAG: hypothetical protein A2806_00290 [Candidatus Terrybacteria bacterium RIFCSPHIGHO2_01_FULL_48_17]OHA53654.1 MAG: hypothetical protein A3A30_00610 [Candidatus Terrybacteria bacterium RIFCSPLOWO2_01_FULL_48_14]
MEKNYPKALVVDRRDLTQDLMILTLKPETLFPFAPGQYCTFMKDGIKRPYSIASAPHEGFLEFFIELVPHGALTPKLWELKIGDTIEMLFNRGKGVFLFEPALHNQVMVCTVTGVAPFVSMIRMLGGSTGHKFYVFQGASYCDEFGYDTELANTKSVTYVSTVSRPQDSRNAAWQGETKRVNERIEEFLMRFKLLPENTMIYACGNSGMIKDVTQRLEPRGYRVRAEEFF